MNPRGRHEDTNAEFGEANLGFLPSILASVDSIEPVAFPEPGRRGGSIRSAGHKLSGTRG